MPYTRDVNVFASFRLTRRVSFSPRTVRNTTTAEGPEPHVRFRREEIARSGPLRIENSRRESVILGFFFSVSFSSTRGRLFTPSRGPTFSQTLSPNAAAVIAGRRALRNSLSRSFRNRARDQLAAAAHARPNIRRSTRQYYRPRARRRYARAPASLEQCRF